MENTKYRLTKNAIEVDGKTLYQIQALQDIVLPNGIRIVSKGDLGGFIESEYNLSTEGLCWVTNKACVYDSAKINMNALVSNYARVHGSAYIYGNAIVSGHAEVFDYARIIGDSCVYGHAKIYGNAGIRNKAIISGDSEVFGRVQVNQYAKIGKCAKVSKPEDYITIGPIGSRNDRTTFYRSKDNEIWVFCGCFNGNINEFEWRVCEVHKGNRHKQTYLAAIEFAKNLFSM